jgi:hypothetical protein
MKPGTISRPLFGLLIAILCIKAVFLFADSRPSYFFGDSATYLATATIKSIPPDRSFLYGLFIRKTAYHWHSLRSLIWIQALISALAAWLVSLTLIRIFSVKIYLAAAAGILCAVEPLQLLSERYVLTESCANFLFALHLLLVLEYVRSGRIRFLLPAQAAGVLLTAFRISFLPLVLLDSVLPPLLWAASTSTKTWRIAVAGAHLFLALVVSQSLLTIYKQWYGLLIHREPALFYEPGAFLVATFSPLIEPEDFPEPSRREAVFRNSPYDRHDLLSRAAQHFVEGGLWPNILKEFPDAKQANEVAEATAIHAVLRQPAATARLATQTFLEYFDTGVLERELFSDEGAENRMDANIRDWLKRGYGVADPKDYELSTVKKWHLLAKPWYWLILCTLPVWALLLFVFPSDDRPALIVCVLAGLLFFGDAILLVDHPTPRFLTSAAWLTLLMAGLAANSIIAAALLRRKCRTFREE